MNDPHVESLIYEISHNDRNSYETAKPLDLETEKFHLRAQNGLATFSLKQHFSTEEEAREVIDPITRSWEISVTLSEGPGVLALEFQRAVVVDRNPSAGVFALQGIAIKASAGVIKAVVGRSEFPKPDFSIGVNDTVEAMHARFENFANGKETLPAVAYYCLTVLENGGGRDNAARRYGIASSVLRKIGELASIKGGELARKALGRHQPYTDNERRWLEATLKAIIKRVAQLAHDANQSLPEISMSDLPSL